MTPTKINDWVVVRFVDGTIKRVQLLQDLNWMFIRAKTKLGVHSPTPDLSFEVIRAWCQDPYTAVQVVVKDSRGSAEGMGFSKRNPIDKVWLSRGVTLATFRAFTAAFTQKWAVAHHLTLDELRKMPGEREAGMKEAGEVGTIFPDCSSDKG